MTAVAPIFTDTPPPQHYSYLSVPFTPVDLTKYQRLVLSGPPPPRHLSTVTVTVGPVDLDTPLAALAFAIDSLFGEYAVEGVVRFPNRGGNHSNRVVVMLNSPDARSQLLDGWLGSVYLGAEAVYTAHTSEAREDLEKRFAGLGSPLDFTVW